MSPANENLNANNQADSLPQAIKTEAQRQSVVSNSTGPTKFLSDLRLFVGRSAIASLVAFILICTIPSSVAAQASAPRTLTLIRPDDPEFEALVADKFPGVQSLQNYARLKPFLLLLKNETPHWATGYAIEWNIRTSNGSVHRQPFIFLQRHDPEMQRKVIAPGEVRLLSPTLNVGPEELPARLQSIANMPMHPYTFKNIVTSVSALIDGVVYEDDAYTGPHPENLVRRYQALRDAERDLGTALLQAFDSDPSADNILGFLSNETRRVDSSSGEDPASLYRMERWQESQSVLSSFRAGGLAGLRQRAREMAQRPPVQVFRLQE